jgi:hypothetical protein
MPGDETTTGDDEREPDAEGPDGAGTADGGGFDVSRRKMLVGGLGVFVGAGVGATATFAMSDPNQIRAQEPNSDGEGTLGELRWILEEKHGLSVTGMMREADTVRVAYESDASSRGESRREIGAVISAYGLIVANGGPTEQLAADIERSFTEQATSYQVQATWVKQWRSGDLSDSGIAQRVFNTRTFPKGATEE